VACEVEAARFAIDAKDRDIVAALIAAVEELAGRVDVEAARIIPSRPLVADVRQDSIGADGEIPTLSCSRLRINKSASIPPAHSSVSRQVIGA